MAHGDECNGYAAIRIRSRCFWYSLLLRSPGNKYLLIDPGGILTLNDFEARFQTEDNETLKGIIVGSYDLGCLAGALVTGPIGNWIGRKRSILLGTTTMMIGAFLQFLAPNFGVMTAGR